MKDTKKFQAKVKCSITYELVLYTRMHTLHFFRKNFFQKLKQKYKKLFSPPPPYFILCGGGFDVRVDT